MELDDMLDLVSEKRTVSRDEAYQVLLSLPGGGELVTGRVPVERSELVAELLEDDPG